MSARILVLLLFFHKIHKNGFTQADTSTHVHLLKIIIRVNIRVKTKRKLEIEIAYFTIVLKFLFQLLLQHFNLIKEGRIYFVKGLNEDISKLR